MKGAVQLVKTQTCEHLLLVQSETAIDAAVSIGRVGKRGETRHASRQGTAHYVDKQQGHFTQARRQRAVADGRRCHGPTTYILIGLHRNWYLHSCSESCCLFRSLLTDYKTYCNASMGFCFVLADVTNNRRPNAFGNFSSIQNYI